MIDPRYPAAILLSNIRLSNRSAYSTSMMLCLSFFVIFASLVPFASGQEEPPLTSRWPTSWSSGWLHVHSTVTDQHLPTVAHRLTTLPIELEQALELKLTATPVRLVVLGNEKEFEQYLIKNFPGLPKRRALFIQNRGPGLVLTYMHSDWLTDARHECTHALLHANSIKLPLWLDEGLAEYFEVEGADKTQHPTHRHAVASQLRYGQVVQIEDFEQSQNANNLSPKEYRDAWSIVSFLINHSDGSRRALRAYIQDLRTGAAAGLLSRRLPEISRANWREDYIQHYRLDAVSTRLSSR